MAPLPVDGYVDLAAARRVRRETSDAREERERLIRMAAYLKAERRGFAPGTELQDWLEAEREIDRLRRPSVMPRRPVTQAPRLSQGRDGFIEHRIGQRVAIQRAVELDSGNGRRFHGLACDLGPEGMFVRTREDASDRCLTVYIDGGGRNGRGVVEIPAFVIHRNNGGVGLLFRALDEYGAALIADLRRPPSYPVAPQRTARLVEGGGR
jgi:hypothetical protein